MTSPRMLSARMAERPAPLDATNGGPLYQQLRHQLFARIRRGEFAGGALLPSENQLCDEYGVSVTTARRALLELVKEGVVRRRMGVGTMVAPSVRQARLAVVSIGYVGHSWRRISYGMAELIVGVGELTWNRDASFSMSGLDEERSDEYLRSLVEARSVDGVLLRTANDVREEHLDILEGAGMPYVVIKRELARRPMNCVVGDDVRGSRLATDHLLQQGHQRIGFVCAMPSLQFSQDRITGYRQGVEAAGIGFDTGLVRLEAAFDEASGARAVRDLLHRRSRPTAIFVASDTMAIGSYQAVRDLGLAIPDDVAIVGYDDIGPVALLTPPLTTVRIAYYDFGRVAAQLLLDLIDGQAERPQRRVIEPALVVRGSSGPPPAEMRKLSTPAPEAAGRTASRRVGVAGPPGEVREAVKNAIAANGDQPILPPDAGSKDVEFEAGLCTLDLRRDLEKGLAITQLEADGMARRLAQRRAGSLVLVAISPTTELSAGAAAAAAAAGVEHMTRVLAARWSSRGIRVNALLATAGNMPSVLAAVLFLLSDEADMTGQTLRIGLPV